MKGSGPPPTGRSRITGPCGAVALCWRGDRLVGVDLVPGRRDCDPLPAALAATAALVADPRTAAGGGVPLRLLTGMDRDGFAWRVLTTLRRRVPQGRVVSYGRLAEMAGCPGGGRAVARVMATNPFPLVFPCHRVVRAGGAVGGFMAGRRGGVARKVRLLAREGVAVRGGKVPRESMA